MNNDENYEKTTSTDTESKLLSFDGMHITLLNRQSSGNFSRSVDPPKTLTHISSGSTKTAEILFLDLRDKVAIYRESLHLSHYTAAVPPDTRWGTWNRTSAQNTQYQLQHGALMQTFYSSADARTTDSGAHDSDMHNTYQGDFMGSCWDNLYANDSKRETTTNQYQESLSISGKDVSGAIDRDDNLFVSVKYLDEKKLEHHFNFLTGGDPVAMTGIINPNPYYPVFNKITPK